jgi:hypothetical protein
MSGKNEELLFGDELLSFYISVCALWFADIFFRGCFDTWHGLADVQFDMCYLVLRTEEGDFVEGGLVFSWLIRGGLLHSLTISCFIF